MTTIEEQAKENLRKYAEVKAYIKTLDNKELDEFISHIEEHISNTTDEGIKDTRDGIRKTFEGMRGVEPSTDD